VDAADLHLLLAPQIDQTFDFSGSHVARIDPGKCTECGTCQDLCRFDAIDENHVVDEIDCEGCGVCVDLCPQEAIAFPEKTNGQCFISTTRFGPMVHARLGIAEENSGKLVSLVRHKARSLVEEQNQDIILTDGPPGVGCPVIASIGGSSAVVIVAEPSVSGVHDMQRVVDLAEHFKVPAMVCVNKYDINPAKTEEIERYAQDHGLRWLGRVPFDEGFARAMLEQKTIMETDHSPAIREKLQEIWGEITNHCKDS
jgi:MinD superfamily P-loop ATPase